jgi:predicted O-linked N-acetylglucosamine transferase (SPINDLY family)
LPVVTCAGRTFASRVAGSLLRAVGLPELVTASLGAYEDLALALATDPRRLHALRDRLARDRATAPLFDIDRFRRHIESAYATMLDLHRRGEKPASFAVAPIGAASAMRRIGSTPSGA